MIQNSFIEQLYPQKYLNELKQKIKYFNKKNNIYLYLFLNMRLILSIIYIGLFIFILPINIFIVLGLIIINHYLLEYLFINLRLKNKERKLYYEGITYYNTLVVFLDNNYNLKDAIKLNSATYNNEISKIYNKGYLNIEAGKDIDDALNDLKDIIPGKFNQKIIFYLLEYYLNDIKNTNKLKLLLTNENKKEENRLIKQVNYMPLKLLIIFIVIFIPMFLALIYYNNIINYITK